VEEGNMTEAICRGYMASCHALMNGVVWLSVEEKSFSYILPSFWWVIGPIEENTITTWLGFDPIVQALDLLSFFLADLDLLCCTSALCLDRTNLSVTLFT